MNTSVSFKTPLFLLTSSILFASLPAAQAETHDHNHEGSMAASSGDNQDAWLVKAKAAYPLDTCVVSGDKLEVSSMGAPVDYTYKEAGKEDRLVRFCCKSCIKTFKKDPAKYLKVIDEAAAAKAKQSGSAH